MERGPRPSWLKLKLHREWLIKTCLILLRCQKYVRVMYAICIRMLLCLCLRRRMWHRCARAFLLLLCLYVQRLPSLCVRACMCANVCASVRVYATPLSQCVCAHRILQCMCLMKEGMGKSQSQGQSEYLTYEWQQQWCGSFRRCGLCHCTFQPHQPRGSYFLVSSMICRDGYFFRWCCISCWAVILPRLL